MNVKPIVGTDSQEVGVSIEIYEKLLKKWTPKIDQVTHSGESDTSQTEQGNLTKPLKNNGGSSCPVEN
jgi:hypothetical protein